MYNIDKGDLGMIIAGTAMLLLILLAASSSKEIRERQIRFYELKKECILANKELPDLNTYCETWAYSQEMEETR